MSTPSKVGFVENKGSVPTVPRLPILTGKGEQCKNSMRGRGTLGTPALEKPPLAAPRPPTNMAKKG
jgi:hypothetical protein